jgi:hypothetical protein
MLVRHGTFFRGWAHWGRDRVHREGQGETPEEEAKEWVLASGVLLDDVERCRLAR